MPIWQFSANGYVTEHICFSRTLVYVHPRTGPGRFVLTFVNIGTRVKGCKQLRESFL